MIAVPIVCKSISIKIGRYFFEHKRTGSEFIILRMHMMTENGTFLRTKIAPFLPKILFVLGHSRGSSENDFFTSPGFQLDFFGAQFYFFAWISCLMNY
jgi:hypothetical protein